ERGVPAALCYPVIGTDSYGMGRLHARSRLSPDERRNRAREFARDYLSQLRFGEVHLRVSSSPLTTEPKMFQVPDMKFGNGKVLSVRGTAGAIQTSLDYLGQARASLLRDHRAGFYDTDRLDRQYFI